MLYAFVWAASFLLYLTTCSESPVSCGDALEFATVSHVRGVAHAPGYPLFSMLGGLSSMILPGTPSFRFGLFTSAIGSTVVVLTYLTLRRVFDHRGLAVTVAAVYAVSYHQWLYSLVMEVSILTAVFSAALPLILWLAYRDGAAERPQERLFYARAWALLLGISFTHHYLVVFLLPGMCWFLVKDLKLGPGSFTTRQWTALAGCFLVGLLPIAYLPYAAYGNPPVNFGDVSSVENLWHHLARTHYGTFSLTAGGQGLDRTGVVSLAPAHFYVEMLSRSFTGVGALLAVVGFAYLIGTNGPAARLYCFSFLLSGLGFFLFTRMIPHSLAARLTLEKFLSVSFVTVPVFIGAACFMLVRHLRWKWWLIGALPVFLFATNYTSLNFRSYRSAEHFGEDLFRSVEPNSLLVIHGDAPLFLAWYLQYVEGHRPDVKVISHSIGKRDAAALQARLPELNIPNNLDGPSLVKEIIEQNFARLPIYQHGISGEDLAASGLDGNPFLLQPSGLAFKVVRWFDPSGDDADIWDSFAVQSKITGPLTQNYSVAEINEMYMIARHNRAAFFYKNGALGRALRYSREALRFDPDFVPTQHALAAMEREARRRGISQ